MTVSNFIYERCRFIFYHKQVVSLYSAMELFDHPANDVLPITIQILLVKADYAEPDPSDKLELPR